MFERGITYTRTINMVTESCCNCGVVFGMPSDLQDEFKKDSSKFFYCPNGHRQHYSESESDRLKKELDRVRQSEQLQRQYRQNAEKELSQERIERRKIKTRLKNVKERVANGVCPCCNRYFENLHRHMSNKHPDFKKEGE